MLNDMVRRGRELLSAIKLNCELDFGLSLGNKREIYLSSILLIVLWDVLIITSRFI